MDETGELTQILNSADNTQERLSLAFNAVYNELRHLAGYVLKGRGSDATLNATSLVHETYARLIGSEKLSITGRRHFFSLCARVMRNILTDYARRNMADKRGGGVANVPLTEDGAIDASKPESIAALDEALTWLEERDPRLVELLQLRIYAGLELPEIAPLLDVSVRQLQRDWSRAQVWLSDALNRGITQ